MKFTIKNFVLYPLSIYILCSELYIHLPCLSCVEDSNRRMVTPVNYCKSDLQTNDNGVQPNNHPPYGLLFPAASAMFTNTAVSENSCMGSLTIGHIHDRGKLECVTLQNKRSRYPNIQRGFPIMRRRAIYYMETTGNCCWELYMKRNFKGESQILFPDENTFFPDFKPASIKKLECKLR